MQSTIVTSPNQAALELLANAGGSAKLSITFFRSVLNMKNFDDADLKLFESVVQEYMNDDKQARAQPPSMLTACPDTLPIWLHSTLATRLFSARSVVPPLLNAFAVRGLGCHDAPEAHWGGAAGGLGCHDAPEAHWGELEGFPVGTSLAV